MGHQGSGDGSGEIPRSGRDSIVGTFPCHPERSEGPLLMTNRETNRTSVLLWTDNTASYLEAIKAAGLADRVLVDSVPRKDKPSAEQLARTEALMAPGVPPGLLPAMPKLRWAQ